MEKTPLQSKQIWTGVAVTLLGVFAVIAEAWAMLSHDQTEVLGQIFGPELIALVGVCMVFLRVVTTTRLVWKQTTTEPSGEPE